MHAPPLADTGGTRSGQLLALKADDPIRQQRGRVLRLAQISPLLRIGCSRLRVIAGGDPVTGRRLDEHQANTCRRQRQDASRAGVKMHHGHSQVSATANGRFPVGSKACFHVPNTCPAPGTTTIPSSHGQSTSYIAIVLGIVASLLEATAPASVSASCTAPRRRS